MRSIVLLAFLLPQASLVAQSGSSAKAPRVSKEAAPADEVAPYVAPRIGTRFVYTAMANTITRVSGWKTYFTDHRGQLGMRQALFIPDDPQSPLTVSDSSLRSIWPLKVGKETRIMTQRGETRYLWQFTVAARETVSVATGTYATYRVDGVQQTLATRDPARAITNIYTWWYAPELRAIVRVNFLQAVGSRQGAMVKNQLVAIERDTTIAR